jgi:hypothetical protein
MLVFMVPRAFSNLLIAAIFGVTCASVGSTSLAASTAPSAQDEDSPVVQGFDEVAHQGLASAMGISLEEAKQGVCPHFG